MNNLQKRKHLIRKLFKTVAKETIGKHSDISLKLMIVDKREYSTCKSNLYGKQRIEIIVGLRGIERNVRIGYPPDYYIDRPDRLNKYIINNRHNALRFILWHELRHAWQRINNINRDNEYQKEYDADGWALAHIKTRPQDRKTKKPDQIKTETVLTRPEPKVAEYIGLYKSGISTTKIALLCKVKDPRTVRYYLTKAGIDLRRRG